MRALRISAVGSSSKDIMRHDVNQCRRYRSTRRSARRAAGALPRGTASSPKDHSTGYRCLEEIRARFGPTRFISTPQGCAVPRRTLPLGYEAAGEHDELTRRATPSSSRTRPEHRASAACTSDDESTTRSPTRGQAPAETARRRRSLRPGGGPPRQRRARRLAAVTMHSSDRRTRRATSSSNAPIRGSQPAVGVFRSRPSR